MKKMCIICHKTKPRHGDLCKRCELTNAFRVAGLISRQRNKEQKKMNAEELLSCVGYYNGELEYKKDIIYVKRGRQ